MLSLESSGQSRGRGLPEPELDRARQGTPHRILVGDSEAWAVELLGQIARRRGIELHHARNGVEAIEKFKTLAPSMVVLDTLLPKLDGLQVASKLREMELGRITPIIVTSAIYREGEDVERLQRRYGFTAFLEKPFSSEQAEQTIEEFLGEEADSAVGEYEVEDGVPLPALPSVAEHDLAEMGVPALLCRLFRSRKSGILTFRQGEVTKVLFFVNGNVTHARSNSKRDRLGRSLLRSHLISPADYQRARQLQIDGSGTVQIGRALIDLGVLSENDIANAVSNQILSIIFGLFGWREGKWSFIETNQIPDEYKRFQFNTANLIFWGLRRLEGRVQFKPHLPNPRAVLERPPESARMTSSLHLTYFEEQIVGLVDGKKRLGEILSLGRITQIDVERVLFSLLVLGVLRVSSAGGAVDQLSLGELEQGDTFLDNAGDLALTSVPRLISRIYHAGVSGALVVVNSQGEEITISFERGEIVSARSSRPEHRLDNVLLAAGKVTDDDYARAGKILAEHPERRISSIFIELRAVSLEELHTALRFQVTAIVLELFRWREGRFSFCPGEPPADIIVTLEATTPNLIMEGVRSIPAPPGIVQLVRRRQGVLTRLWGDERVENLLRLSSAERRLLAYIESGRSMRDVVSLGLLDSETLSRVLHGLLALEVIRKVSLEEVQDTAHAAADEPASDPALAAIDEEDESTGELDLEALDDLITGTDMTPPELKNDALRTLAEENQTLRERIQALEVHLKTLNRSAGGPGTREDKS